MEMEDILIGIAKRNVNLNMRAWDSGAFWGFIAAGGRKFCPSSPAPQIIEYGGFSKISDTIGVLLEFKEGEGQLQFFRNQVSHHLSHITF